MPIPMGAAMAPKLDASTRVDAAATRFSGVTQSLARATNWPYRGKTNAPNAMLTTMMATLKAEMRAPMTARPQDVAATTMITARRG